MPPHYARLPELRAPDNLIIDVKPMQNALMERRKAQEFDINKEMEQQRLDQKASQFAQSHGLQQKQFGLREQEHNQQMADRKIKMIGGMAQVIDEEQNPQARQVMWQRMRGMTPEFDGLLQKYGVDPNDHLNGPKFVLAQAGQYDPMKKAERESAINYRNALADEAADRGRARTMDAQTKAFRTIADHFGDKMPTEAEWNQGLQPGGIVNVAFGGRMVPYTQSQTILAAGKKNRELEDTELLNQGFSEQQIKDMRRSQSFEKALGPPKRGFIWDSNDKGQPYQKKVTDSDEKGTLPVPQIEAMMESIKTAFPIIAGTPDRKGNLKGGSNIIEQGASAIPFFGQRLTPALDEAYRSTEHAALQLSYALSGKQIGQAEQGRIIQMYVPVRGDSNEIAAFKMNAAQALFQRLLEAKKGGVTDKARAEMFDSAMAKQSRYIMEKQAGAQGSQSKTQGRVPPAGRGVKSLSNDELLKRLQE